MGDSVRVTITGQKEAEAKLADLDAKVQKKLASDSLRAAGKPIQQAVKRGAPVGFTGNLRRGVKLKKPRRRRSGEAAALLVKAASPHAHLVEQGTKARKPKKTKALKSSVTEQFFGRRVGPMPSNPFAARAFQATSGQAVKAAGDTLASGIVKAAKG